MWRAVHSAASRDSAGPAGQSDEALAKLVHRAVKAVTSDYDRFGFNVAIAKLMTLTNELQRALDASVDAEVTRDAAEKLVLMLAPMAPHIGDELWREVLGHPENVVTGARWPEWDEALAREEEVVLVVQVDGRVRDRITVGSNASEEECRRAALQSVRARAALNGREIDRVIVRPPRLVNLVTRRTG